MELDKLEEFQKRERDYVQMMEEQSAKTYEAYRLHHLLSTKQVSVEHYIFIWNTNKDIIRIKVSFKSGGFTCFSILVLISQLAPPPSDTMSLNSKGVNKSMQNKPWRCPLLLPTLATNVIIF